MGTRAVIASAMLAAATMAGCGHAPSLDIFDDDPRFVAGQFGDPPMDDPDSIIARAHAVSFGAGGTRHIGAIIDTGSARPYLLDTGDKLRIFVYGQPNLSRLYAVDQSGVVSVPLIGSVRARGLTTTQLEGAIRGRLGQQLVRDPQVTVDVQQNRPFFSLGEVRLAGQYPYVNGMTVENAVAIAGGYGDRANERKVRVTRRNGGVTELMEVTPDIEIEPGDTVYVYERFF